MAAGSGAGRHLLHQCAQPSTLPQQYHVLALGLSVRCLIRRRAPEPTRSVKLARGCILTRLLECACGCMCVRTHISYVTYVCIDMCIYACTKHTRRSHEGTLKCPRIHTQAIVDLWLRQGKNVRLCAPTGRAAQQLQVCVCARALIRVRAQLCLCVCVCVCARAFVCAHVCLQTQTV